MFSDNKNLKDTVNVKNTDVGVDLMIKLFTEEITRHINKNILESLKKKTKTLKKEINNMK
jgi:hypothetical protein